MEKWLTLPPDEYAKLLHKNHVLEPREYKKEVTNQNLYSDEFNYSKVFMILISVTVIDFKLSSSLANW